MDNIIKLDTTVNKYEDIFEANDGDSTLIVKHNTRFNRVQIQLTTSGKTKTFVLDPLKSVGLMMALEHSLTNTR